MEFSNIYREYSPKIYRICLGYINDPEKAKDLTQETFISVWQNRSSFRNEASIGTWIYRIASNKCLRFIQYEKRFPKTALPFSLPEETTNQPETEQKMLFLRNCIAELNEIDRLIIGMYLEEVPQEKIAHIIGISHANIRVKVHRIKEKLAEKFKAHGQF